MQIKTLTDYLEQVAPLAFQESYDNSGLIVGYEMAELKGVLVCLDVTEEIVDEAISLGCNLIVAHHPVIFQGLKKLTGENFIQRTVVKAIRHDIAIYAAHTNLDNTLVNGVNDKIAQMIGLKDIRPLQRKSPLLAEKYDKDPLKTGTGLIGFLPQPMPPLDFLRQIKTNMQVPTLKYTKLPGHNIEKIALCGGAGGFLLKHAIAAGADLFLSSDFKYHEYFNADGRIVIADIGHFESERFTIDVLYELISDKFRTFAVHYTKCNTNPIQYL